MLTPEFWKRYLKVYDALNLLPPYQELLDIFCRALEIGKGEKILEAGCGTGNLAVKLKQKGASVVCLDNCSFALDVCRQKDSVMETILADLTKRLPFSDNYFDKIVSNNTIYAMTEEKQLTAFKEFFRILKPGGRIVVSNLKKGWNPLKVYLYSVLLNTRERGWIDTAKKITMMIGPTVEIFYCNFLIGKNTTYHFFAPGEQKTLLERAGFVNLGQSRLVYAGQSVMDSAIKPIQ